MKHWFALLCGAVAFCATAGAQPAPKLNPLPREWLQRGNFAEFNLTGENLQAAERVLITGAGITPEIVPPPGASAKVESALGGIATVAQPDPKTLRVRLRLEHNAPLTEREIRVVTPGGISNPQTLRVSHLPEVDAAKNLSRETAQSVALPAAITGVINNSAEVHHFRISGAKGERIILDCQAFRIGSKLDSSLALLDKEGRVLARGEDESGLDSTLDFVLPESGQYRIELRDFRYQGGADYRYRLIAGANPLVKAAFPFGGRRGSEVDIRLQGANLEGSENLRLRLAADAPLGRREIRAATPRGLSNPFLFEVTDWPQILEAEPNTALDQAQSLPVPGAVSGRIDRARDYDAFQFRAGAGQRVNFEIQAFRQGSPLDAVLALVTRDGTVLQRNDDSAGADARVEHTFAEAGEYWILVEDLQERGGEAFTYQLTAQLPSGDFSLVTLPDAPRVRRGSRVPVRCEITRLNGFGGPVRVLAEDLPAGTYAEPLLLSPSGLTSGHLMLHASPQAATGTFPLKIVATAAVDGRTVRHGAQPFSGDRTARQAFVTVLEEAPFSIAPATLTLQLEQNQSDPIEVTVHRADGFTGEITVTPEGFSAGREPAGRSFDFQPLVLKAGELSAPLRLRAKLDAEIGTRNLFLRAEAAAGETRWVDYSTVIPVTTVPLPFVISTSLKRLLVTALPAGSVSAASEALFSAKVERRAGFAGEIELKLDGVPEGMTATVEKIAAGQNEAPIKLVATDRAPTGKDFSITVTGVATHQDRNYRFAAPPLTVTINAPEKDPGAELKLSNVP